jgi:hypothetical protein
VILKEAAKNRGFSSCLGIESERPLIFARQRMLNPPKARQRDRNVQGEISVRAIFMMGQLKPQKKVRAPRRTRARERWGVALFPPL